MARNFDSDQIIALVNESSASLGFYLMEINDKLSGYSIVAAFDREIDGHSVSIIFYRDVFHVSRLYSREEIGHIVEILSAIYDNVSF